MGRMEISCEYPLYHDIHGEGLKSLFPKYKPEAPEYIQKDITLEIHGTTIERTSAGKIIYNPGSNYLIEFTAYFKNSNLYCLSSITDFRYLYYLERVVIKSGMEYHLESRKTINSNEIPQLQEIYDFMPMSESQCCEDIKCFIEEIIHDLNDENYGTDKNDGRLRITVCAVDEVESNKQRKRLSYH